jgi:hypothetical protein
MLVCESMDASFFICTIAKSSIRCLSHPIPSIEFSPTNSSEDEGNLFIHSNPLEQVHIVYTSVTKLLLVERLVLLHLLSATDGNVIAIRHQLLELPLVGLGVALFLFLSSAASQAFMAPSRSMAVLASSL